MEPTQPAGTLRPIDDVQICTACGKPFVVSLGQITFGPHPYNEWIHDDATPVWLCTSCRKDAQDDI